MSTAHKLVVEIEVKHRPAGMGLPDDEFEVSYPKVEIEVRYTPGSPGVRMTRNGDGWPPDPPEIDLVSARLIDGDGLNPTPEKVTEWVQGYLDDDDRGFNFVASEIEKEIDNGRYREGD